MISRLKIYIIVVPFLVYGIAGCKKGTFDINNSNPNFPSSAPPGQLLSAALAGSAYAQYGPGFTDILGTFMGYLSISAGYIPNAAWETYNFTSDFGSNNWDAVYPVLENYVFIQNTAATDPSQANYVAIAKIMLAYHFSRLVDFYNDIPYSSALLGSAGLFPTYDSASTVYLSCIKQLDSAVMIINNNPLAVSPGAQDIMFGGNMAQWAQFANTAKLRILMNLTQTPTGPALITSELAGLTPTSFLSPGEDAVVQPGYSNGSGTQQTPMWVNFGWTTSGGAQNNENYLVACSYVVNFWNTTNDSLRPPQVFCLNGSGIVRGRAFGSQDATETSPSVVSLVGYPANPPSGGPYTSGILISPSAGSVLFSASESLFLQAEAAQRGYLTGATANQLYQSAVAENFRILGVANPLAAATSYTSQPLQMTNLSISTNPIQTIIMQKYAALVLYDPLESWCDWRRLGIPTDLPVSIYPGTTATHIPYRLLYPTSEYKYNTANVNKEGTIDPLNSKIFWMP
jgi:Starch-binding associating with outer membrane